MPRDLEILCDTIDIWSFQFRCWSTIAPKNFALVTLCIASLHKMTSPYGFRVFFLDIINIWVLFTLRVSLLESNHSAALVNSELRSLYPEWPHRQGGCLTCWGCMFESRWGCTNLYYACDAQGVLPMRAGGATSQLDLLSLTPLFIAGCGWLQLGVPHWAASVHYWK